MSGIQEVTMCEDVQNVNPIIGISRKRVEMIIYKVTNLINGKEYIGLSTRGLKKRKGEHLRHYKTGEGYFYKAIRKYGPDLFSWKEICICSTHTELVRKEIESIRLYGTKAPNGYNLTDGGDGPLNPSIETREKMGAWQRGRTKSVETREKLRIANTGKVHSPETRAKISAISKRHRNSPETREKISAANKGRVVSDQARENMSAAQKGRKRAPFTTEHRANISASKKGVKRPPPTAKARENMSAAQKGRKQLPRTDGWKAKQREAHKGWVPSDTTRAKMSAAQHRLQKQKRFLK